jgi:hypothetical protein
MACACLHVCRYICSALVTLDLLELMSPNDDVNDLWSAIEKESMKAREQEQINLRDKEKFQREMNELKLQCSNGNQNRSANVPTRDDLRNEMPDIQLERMQLGPNSNAEQKDDAHSHMHMNDQSTVQKHSTNSQTSSPGASNIHSRRLRH